MSPEMLVLPAPSPVTVSCLPTPSAPHTFPQISHSIPAAGECFLHLAPLFEDVLLGSAHRASSQESLFSEGANLVFIFTKCVEL